MLSIKTLLFILPLSAVAQIILSPVSCTLVCIERSLSATTCEKAQSGISDPSVIPCLCEDEEFMRETVNCLVNSGECMYPSPFHPIVISLFFVAKHYFLTSAAPANKVVDP